MYIKHTILKGVLNIVYFFLITQDYYYAYLLLVLYLHVAVLCLGTMDVSRTASFLVEGA